MHVSWSEMETLATKAAIGIGVPAGLAEEAGLAVAWLGRSGRPGATIIWRALQNISTGYASPVAMKDKKSLQPKVSGTLASALYAAPSVADFLHLLPEIRVEKLDEPLLLFGHLAASSALLNRGLVFQAKGLGNESWKAFIKNGCVIIDDELYRDFHQESGSEVIVTVINDPDDWVKMADRYQIGVRQKFENSMTITEKEMINLQRFSEQMLVPESATSRTKGAGAGVIDTD